MQQIVARSVSAALASGDPPPEILRNISQIFAPAVPVLNNPETLTSQKQPTSTHQNQTFFQQANDIHADTQLPEYSIADIVLSSQTVYIGSNNDNTSEPSTQQSKKWHESVQPSDRNKFVLELIKAITSTSVDCATKYEAEVYNTAKSQSEYNLLLENKISSIQKGLGEFLSNTFILP